MSARHMLTIGAAIAAFLGGLAAAPASADSNASASSATILASHDAYADLYEGSEWVARVHFDAAGDHFILTKKSNRTYSGRAYMEWEYTTVAGNFRTGRHNRLSQVGIPVDFNHNFGEGRKVELRVCVEDAWFDPCSDWETGYA
ncbi:hypothetical protein [Streptomyces sp. NPDC056672]|uniref:hypothetical protein n=1 Tax=Streptomyces sp. NPDC056672 TaxID=3345906 RepID=UPI00369362D4